MQWSAKEEYMGKFINSKLKLTVFGLILAIGSFFALNVVYSNVGAAGCSGNSVVKCGVWSEKEMRDKYNSDFTKGTKTIYSHMGVTSDMVNKAPVKKGTIHKNGNVYVDGKLVATDAITAGRWYYPGSTKHVKNGTTFYTRTTQVSFVTKSVWEIYVFTDKNGKFIGGVILDCGNPVKAKPVEPPKPQPKPAYVCKSLAPLMQTRTTYRFKALSDAKNGAKYKGFTFDFGDGNKKFVASTTSRAETTHTYAKAGNYTAKLTAHFTVNGKEVTATAPNCSKPVTVKEQPAPKVAKCVQLTAKRIGAKSFELNAQAEVSGGATISSYYFVIRNIPTSNPSVDPIYFQERVNTTATSAKVETGELTALQDGGKYLATVAVTTSEGVKTSTNCQVEITVPKEDKPEMVEACNTETGLIEKVEKGKENTAPYTTDFSKCEVEVCNPETGEIIRVPKKDEDKYLPVDDKACKDEEPPVEEVPVCNPETGKIITVPKDEVDKYLDKDSEECKEKEKPVVKETVTELPKTGVAEQLSGVLGLGALTTAMYYYVTSRRNG